MLYRARNQIIIVGLHGNAPKQIEIIEISIVKNPNLGEAKHGWS
jgi:hypothetical protein